VFGLMSLFLGLIPRAVIAPIFLFIGFEIVHQAYRESPDTHSAAVSLSFLPVVAHLVIIIVRQFLNAVSIAPEERPVRLQLLHSTLTPEPLSVESSEGKSVTGR
jgi:AGZA family xanthine/uracil permease-like MFS transporter